MYNKDNEGSVFMISSKNFEGIIGKIITILVTIILVIFIIYALKLGILSDKMKLVEYMKNFGLLGGVFFIFIQALQVVFPIIPGGASCLAGVLAFGPILGFIYNLLGLILGSIIAYLLSKTYGLTIIKKIFREETINKYIKYIQTKHFEKIFFLGILLPGLPDDLLCYLSGISDMSLKRFIIYIILGKPFTLIFYSLFFQLL